MGEVLRRLAVVVVMAGVFTLCGCVSPKPSGKASSKDSQPGASVPVNDVIKAIYISPKGARLKASFDTKANTVAITLPSGRSITLPRAISGSGARYSNDRETFWEHHGEASYWIGEKRMFQGKVQESK